MVKIRKTYSDWQAPAIQSLMKLIETQSKATLAHWAIDYSEQIMEPLWRKHFPSDSRPQQAIAAARLWLDGEIKLPVAKVEILACHQAARDAEGIAAAQAAARAIGQSASTIHSARHCIGLAFYGALAIAYDQLGTEVPWHEIELTARQECLRMEAALHAAAVADEPNPAKISWKF